jgi:hypothetical protein
MILKDAEGNVLDPTNTVSGASVYVEDVEYIFVESESDGTEVIRIVTRSVPTE